jgi:hypothetical protein
VEGGDEIGRGGRCTIFFLDEAAYLPNAEKADTTQTTWTATDLAA